MGLGAEGPDWIAHQAQENTWWQEDLLIASTLPTSGYTAPACSSSLTQAALPHLELTVWSGVGQ